MGIEEVPACRDSWGAGGTWQASGHGLCTRACCSPDERQQVGADELSDMKTRKKTGLVCQRRAPSTSSSSADRRSRFSNSCTRKREGFRVRV